MTARYINLHFTYLLHRDRMETGKNRPAELTEEKPSNLWKSLNNNNYNYQISIAPYGRNFRGAGGRSDQCSVKRLIERNSIKSGLKTSIMDCRIFLEARLHSGSQTKNWRHLTLLMDPFNGQFPG